MHNAFVCESVLPNEVTHTNMYVCMWKRIWGNKFVQLDVNRMAIILNEMHFGLKLNEW